MKPSLWRWRGLSLFGLLLVVYCAWEARGLVDDWTTNPRERWGHVAFAVWLAPWLLARAATPPGRRRRVESPAWQAAALALCLAGRLGDVNALCHAALLCAVAAGVRWRRVSPGRRLAFGLWLAAGGLCLPAASWLLSVWPTEQLLATRLAAAALTAAIWAAVDGAAWRSTWPASRAMVGRKRPVAPVDGEKLACSN